jgi:hypothetical protein
MPKIPTFSASCKRIAMAVRPARDWALPLVIPMIMAYEGAVW